MEIWESEQPVLGHVFQLDPAGDEKVPRDARCATQWTSCQFELFLRGSNTAEDVSDESNLEMGRPDALEQLDC